MSKRANVEASAAEVEHHPAAAWAASAGQVVNGVVHIIIGLIAVGIARGAGGSADQSGALRAIGRVVKPGRRQIITSAEVTHVDDAGQEGPCALMQQTLVPVPKEY